MAEKVKKKSQQQTLSSGERTHRLFAVIQDTATGQNYAAEILKKNGQTKAHLLAKAKKGKYQPIWFNPKDQADPPESKIARNCPKGWSPYTISPDQDDSWVITSETTPNLGQLRL